MDAEKEALRAENKRLRARVTELEAGNAGLEATVAKLMARIADLEGSLEKVRREGKRQAAPFRKAKGPRPDPKKPGRKSGEEHGRHAHRQAPPPEAIDERYEAPLPECCPHCGSDDLEEDDGVVFQYQTEISRRPIQREFAIHRGRCRHCGRPVQGRHALQTSDVVGAAAAQLGPEAHAAIAVLNKELGLPHGKVSRCLGLFGVDIARGTSARSMLRSGRRCEPIYEAIRTSVRNSPWAVPDETGWRVGGRNAWLHVVVGESATCYEVAPGRGHEVLEGILGKDWSGRLTHDGWGPYDYFSEARHQQCLWHLRSRCEEILETAPGGAVRLPRQVLELLDVAFEVRRRHEAGQLSENDLVDAGLILGCDLEKLIEGRFTYPPNRRLAKHLGKHTLNWFWFLIEPGTDATNYRAEQAIRPAVVNRKVWGGNRTWIGARAQSVITSILRTCAQLGRSAIDYLVSTLCTPRPDPTLLFAR